MLREEVGKKEACCFTRGSCKENVSTNEKKGPFKGMTYCEEGGRGHAYVAQLKKVFCALRVCRQAVSWVLSRLTHFPPDKNHLITLQIYCIRTRTCKS
jgi:hypothetical protein